MKNIIPFPTERTARHKTLALMRLLEEKLHLWRINKAIEHLDAVAELNRRECREFRAKYFHRQ